MTRHWKMQAATRNFLTFPIVERKNLRMGTCPFPEGSISGETQCYPTKKKSMPRKLNETDNVSALST